MLIINAKLPTKNLKITKSLSQLIQGFLYRYLPASEHVGYRHESSGKIFKRTVFDFILRGEDLRVRFASCEPEFERKIALAVLKDGLSLGEILFTQTTVEAKNHKIFENEAIVQGYVACVVSGLLGHKVYLQPQDSRHLEMMKTNILQRFETIMGRKYDGEMELNLLWQKPGESVKFYYGNNREPVYAWQARWKISANAELINLILGTGAGSGCMNYGVGVLEVVKQDLIKVQISNPKKDNCLL